jgi:hypothetical protein
MGAAIAATDLITGPAAGLYRISVYLASQADGTGNLAANPVRITYTDSGTSPSKTLFVPVFTVSTGAELTTAFTFTAGNAATGLAIIQVASGNIQYLTSAYTGTGSYNLYITADRLQ